MPSVTAYSSGVFQLAVPTVGIDLIFAGGRAHIPPGIVTLEDFRAWSLSEHFPKDGRIDYLRDMIEVDLST
jgi:hypothetical protein